MNQRRNWLALLLCCAAAVVSGCGASAAQVEPAIEPATDEPAKARNADALARSIVGGKVGILMYVEPVREHSLGPKVRSLNLWTDFLEGTDLDPMDDLERVFVTAPTAHAGEALVAVGEHSQPEERLRAALEKLIAKSDPPGTWLQDAAVPAARVMIEDQWRVIALATPNLIVVLPEQHAAEVAKFADSAGLPDPEGPEALVLTAEDPSKTIDGSSAVKIPSTISRARGTITPTDDDGVDLYTEGVSSSPEQAKADAEALTERIAKVLTVKIAVVKVQLFKPVEFKAEGTQVIGERHLTKAEIDRMFMFAAGSM